MLFNSYQFLFLFLPLAIAAFRLVPRDPIPRAVVLGAASLIFYAAWDWHFLALLLGSIAVNYRFGLAIRSAVRRQADRHASRLLFVGVAFNLLLIGVFKYAMFTVDNVNTAFGTDFVIGHIVLPLGISFFTFEQISFLVDLRRGHEYRLHPLRYCVFVAFFPRLVAGPILRYGEIVPQLERMDDTNRWADLAVGLSIFAFGLAKKAFLADGISPFVAPPFQAAAGGQALDFFAAWGGALAYTMQLYFDFSGYSDMAIGAARCFGIRFPQNFNSPYKATNIIEFWRRWHMTLSRFLRDYLYIPLGGNRRGKARRYVNLMITMVLGGFWHGAAWTFLAWGALHGAYLMINHGWIAVSEHAGRIAAFRNSPAGRAFGWTLTFLAVVAAWVFFRATSFHAGFVMLSAMLGAHGVEVPAAVAYHFPWLARLGIQAGGSGTEFVDTWLWIIALTAIALAAPNTQEIFTRSHPTLEHPLRARWIVWHDNAAWAIAVGAVAFLGILSITRTSVFLYWQF
ncbi:MAG TPA: MBOAT family protein [Acetobacteraceae bacterium]|jgi:D-alanyl-lipoteichoic acid acyltransferase DltB (MBOAT superfamily)